MKFAVNKALLNKRQWTIKTKLMFISTVVVVISFLILSLFVRYILKDNIESLGINNVKQTISKVSFESTERIRETLNIAKTLSSVLISLRNDKIKREVAFNIFKELAIKNSHILSIFSIWEIDTYDGKDYEYRNKFGHDETGRFIASANRGSGEGVRILPSTNVEENTKKASFYVVPKTTKKQYVTDPYYYEYIKGKGYFFITTTVSPIVIDDIFMGIVGCDLGVDYLDSLIKKIKLFETRGPQKI